ncbi:diadenylate cyclase CdaA [soil metagenome]
MLYLFIKIGFLEIGFADLFDIFLVGLLIYQIYRLLKGSLALNILLGLVLVYFVWFLVGLLEMRLLANILGQFIEVGVIALLIVFQPEIRKFLLYLGRGNVFRKGISLRRLFSRNNRKEAEYYPVVKSILSAVDHMRERGTGTILVLCESSRLQFYANTGVLMDSLVSSKLLESIFEKNSPMHDGAVIISDLRIIAAGCVLPVSDNPELPSRIGMRHKATVGITELSDALSIVVSEERFMISYARNGRLIQNVTTDELRLVLIKFYEAYY